MNVMHDELEWRDGYETRPSPLQLFEDGFDDWVQWLRSIVREHTSASMIGPDPHDAGLAGAAGHSGDAAGGPPDAWSDVSMREVAESAAFPPDHRGPEAQTPADIEELFHTLT